MTVVAELCSGISTCGAVVFVSKKLRITNRRIIPRSAPFGRCGFVVVTKNSYCRAMVVTEVFLLCSCSGGEESVARFGVLLFDRFGASTIMEVDILSGYKERHNPGYNRNYKVKTVCRLPLRRLLSVDV